MAVDRRVTADTAIAGADVADDDLFDLVDVDDPTDAPTGTSKKITAAQARIALGGTIAIPSLDEITALEADTNYLVDNGDGNERITALNMGLTLPAVSIFGKYDPTGLFGLPSLLNHGTDASAIGSMGLAVAPSNTHHQGPELDWFWFSVSDAFPLNKAYAHILATASSIASGENGNIDVGTYIEAPNGNYGSADYGTGINPSGSSRYAGMSFYTDQAGNVGAELRIADGSNLLQLEAATGQTDPMIRCYANGGSVVFYDVGVDGKVRITDGTSAWHAVSKGQLDAAIAAVINSAPGALDTLDELAAALGDDANFAATITAAIAAKVADTAYGSGWDGVTTIAPSKNAVYDKIETLATLASPVFTGGPTAPTQSAVDNSTKLATTAYVDTAGGLLIPKSLVDTKGDLLVGSADNTVIRKAVGSDGTVLTADTASTGGVKWSTPAAASSAPSLIYANTTLR